MGDNGGIRVGDKVIGLDGKRMIGNMTMYRNAVQRDPSLDYDAWHRAGHGMIHFLTIVMLEMENAAGLEPICLLDMMFVLSELERSADPT